MVKMITAREMDIATPKEFLFYLFMPFDTFSIGKYVLSRFRIKRDRDPVGTVLGGIRDGIEEASKDSPEMTLGRWVHDTRTGLTQDLDAVAASILEGKYRFISDLPPGYRAN